jgi:hypothetical protein
MNECHQPQDARGSGEILRAPLYLGTDSSMCFAPAAETALTSGFFPYVCGFTRMKLIT